MISHKDAVKFSESHHPAFAGYLIDGNISELDLLGTIFHLFEGKYLIPVFKNGDITAEIDIIKKGTIAPATKFDEIFIRQLFGDRLEMTSREIGNKISSTEFKIAMKYIFEWCAGIQSEEIRTFLGNSGIEINPFEIKNRKAKALVNLGFLVLANIVFVPMIFNENPINIFKIIGIVITNLMGFLIFKYQLRSSNTASSFKLTKTYSLDGLRSKYKELHEFLDKNRLGEHYLANELLPFSIAFGIDQSWNKDFGLEKYYRPLFL